MNQDKLRQEEERAKAADLLSGMPGQIKRKGKWSHERQDVRDYNTLTFMEKFEVKE